MNEESVKRIIGGWFVSNRPDIDEVNGITEELKDDVYQKVKNDIEGLEREGTTLIVRKYLKENYESELFLILEKMVMEEPFRKEFTQWKEIGFLYTSEMGSIMYEIQKANIDNKDIEGIRRELCSYLEYQGVKL